MSKNLKPIKHNNSLSRIDEMFSRFFNGFEHPFSMLDNRLHSNYNIKKLKDNEYSINLNVAGFNKEDISISLDKDTLVIRGDNHLEQKDDEYIYQGFSSSFSNSFSLSGDSEVKDAYIKDGILTIIIKENIKENKNVKNITIR